MMMTKRSNNSIHRLASSLLGAFLGLFMSVQTGLAQDCAVPEGEEWRHYVLIDGSGSMDDGPNLFELVVNQLLPQIERESLTGMEMRYYIFTALPENKKKGRLVFETMKQVDINAAKRRIGYLGKKNSATPLFFALHEALQSAYDWAEPKPAQKKRRVWITILSDGNDGSIDEGGWTLDGSFAAKGDERFLDYALFSKEFGALRAKNRRSFIRIRAVELTDEEIGDLTDIDTLFGCTKVDLKGTEIPFPPIVVGSLKSPPGPMAADGNDDNDVIELEIKLDVPCPQTIKGKLTLGVQSEASGIDLELDQPVEIEIVGQMKQFERTVKIRVNGPDDLRRTGFKGQVTLKLDQQLNPEFETETIPFKVPPRDKVELDPASLLLGRVIRPKEPLVVEYLDPPAGVKPNWSIIREDTGKVEQLVDIRDWEFNQSADERGSYTVRLVGTDPTGKRNDSEPLDKTFEVVDLDVVIKGPSEIPSSFGPDERASGGGDYKAELVGQDAGKYELDRATWDVSKANYETVEDQGGVEIRVTSPVEGAATIFITRARVKSLAGEVLPGELTAQRVVSIVPAPRIDLSGVGTKQAWGTGLAIKPVVKGAVGTVDVRVKAGGRTVLEKKGVGLRELEADFEVVALANETKPEDKLQITISSSSNSNVNADCTVQLRTPEIGYVNLTAASDLTVGRDYPLTLQVNGKDRAVVREIHYRVLTGQSGLRPPNAGVSSDHEAESTIGLRKPEGLSHEDEVTFQPVPYGPHGEEISGHRWEPITFRVLYEGGRIVINSETSQSSYAWNVKTPIRFTASSKDAVAEDLKEIRYTWFLDGVKVESVKDKERQFNFTPESAGRDHVLEVTAEYPSGATQKADLEFSIPPGLAPGADSLDIRGQEDFTFYGDEQVTIEFEWWGSVGSFEVIFVPPLADDSADVTASPGMTIEQSSPETHSLTLPAWPKYERQREITVSLVWEDHEGNEGRHDFSTKLIHRASPRWTEFILLAIGVVALWLLLRKRFSGNGPRSWSLLAGPGLDDLKDDASQRRLRIPFESKRGRYWSPWKKQAVLPLQAIHSAAKRVTDDACGLGDWVGESGESFTVDRAGRVRFSGRKRIDRYGFARASTIPVIDQLADSEHQGAGSPELYISVQKKDRLQRMDTFLFYGGLCIALALLVGAWGWLINF